MEYAKNSLGRSTGRKFNMAAMKREFQKMQEMREPLERKISFAEIEMGGKFSFIMASGVEGIVWEKIGEGKAWPITGNKCIGVPYNVGVKSQVVPV